MPPTRRSPFSPWYAPSANLSLITNKPQQGMGWMLRKALNMATITLQVHTHADTADPKLLHVDIDQVVTGGIKGTSEHRTTDWVKREHEDHIFGRVEGRSRLLRGVKGDDGKVRPGVDFQTQTDDETVKKFLRGEVLADGSETEGFLVEAEGEEYGEGEGLWLQSFVSNLDSGWTAEQVFSFPPFGSLIWVLGVIVMIEQVADVCRSGVLRTSMENGTTLVVWLCPRMASLSWLGLYTRS